MADECLAIERKTLSMVLCELNNSADLNDAKNRVIGLFYFLDLLGLASLPTPQQEPLQPDDLKKLN